MNTILIVEDSLDILETLGDIFTNANYRTILAQNGEEALMKLKTETPDVIICDILMPKIDGYQLYEKVKENPMLSIIPFIILSAKNEIKDFRYGMNIGVDDYIFKPFRVKDLLTAVSIRINKSKNIFRISQSKKY